MLYFSYPQILSIYVVVVVEPVDMWITLWMAGADATSTAIYGSVSSFRPAYGGVVTTCDVDKSVDKWAKLSTGSTG